MYYIIIIIWIKFFCLLIIYKNNKLKFLFICFLTFQAPCQVENRYVVTTIAGTGEMGDQNGPGSISTFKYPQGIAVDSNGNIFIADLGNCLIRKIDKLGNVTSFAVKELQLNLVDSLSRKDLFPTSPNDLIFDRKGNLIICTLQNKLSLFNSNL